MIIVKYSKWSPKLREKIFGAEVEEKTDEEKASDKPENQEIESISDIYWYAFIYENEKMNEFRKEDNRLMENFIQYTQNDEVNINELDWKLRDIEDGFLQEANKSIFKLEEVASELNKEYEKALLELDK